MDRNLVGKTLREKEREEIVEICSRLLCPISLIGPIHMYRISCMHILNGTPIHIWDNPCTTYTSVFIAIYACLFIALYSCYMYVSGLTDRQTILITENSCTITLLF